MKLPQTKEELDALLKAQFEKGVNKGARDERRDWVAEARRINCEHSVPAAKEVGKLLKSKLLKFASGRAERVAETPGGIPGAKKKGAAR